MGENVLETSPTAYDTSGLYRPYKNHRKWEVLSWENPNALNERWKFKENSCFSFFPKLSLRSYFETYIRSQELGFVIHFASEFRIQNVGLYFCGIKVASSWFLPWAKLTITHPFRNYVKEIS